MQSKKKFLIHCIHIQKERVRSLDFVHVRCHSHILMLAGNWVFMSAFCKYMTHLAIIKRNLDMKNMDFPFFRYFSIKSTYKQQWIERKNNDSSDTVIYDNVSCGFKLRVKWRAPLTNISHIRKIIVPYRIPLLRKCGYGKKGKKWLQEKYFSYLKKLLLLALGSILPKINMYG